MRNAEFAYVFFPLPKDSRSFPCTRNKGNFMQTSLDNRDSREHR